MRYLLDSHTFIWLDGDESQLTEKVMELCRNDAHDLILSVASIWEIQIKLQAGKLELRAPLEEIILSQQETNGIELLPINARHVLTLNTLPDYHKDPFDRMLITQAIVEDAIIISRDSIIAKYPVAVVW